MADPNDPEEIARYYGWMGIEHSEKMFIECETVIKTMRCRVHKKRAYAEWEYTENYETHSWVRKACCMEFAREVAAVLVNKAAFNIVSIDLGWPHLKK
ncbi:MAG: hypothetical protein IT249_08040 [Chitinophagaceae bacterium]|nr:hypothetical protein [Chitinophagaceae bacterium]